MDGTVKDETVFDQLGLLTKLLGERIYIRHIFFRQGKFNVLNQRGFKRYDEAFPKAF